MATATGHKELQICPRIESHPDMQHEKTWESDTAPFFSASERWPNSSDAALATSID
jgi:hypothetical protein